MFLSSHPAPGYTLRIGVPLVARAGASASMWMKLMLLSWLMRPCVYLCACARACVRARAPPLPAHALQANTPKATRAETLQAPNAAGRKHRHERQRRLTGVVMQAHAVDAVASLATFKPATFKPATLELHHGNIAAGGFGSCDHRETLEAAE